MAKEAGYAEPDPRIDLSGKDVIRKLVILAREAGYPVEQADVKRNLFIPEKYFEGSLEDFWKNIKDTDAGFPAQSPHAARTISLQPYIFPSDISCRSRNIAISSFLFSVSILTVFCKRSNKLT